MINFKIECKTCDHLEGLDEEWCFMHKVRPVKTCFHHTDIVIIEGSKLRRMQKDLFEKMVHKFKKKKLLKLLESNLSFGHSRSDLRKAGAYNE